MVAFSVWGGRQCHSHCLSGADGLLRCSVSVFLDRQVLAEFESRNCHQVVVVQGVDETVATSSESETAIAGMSSLEVGRIPARLWLGATWDCTVF